MTVAEAHQRRIDCIKGIRSMPSKAAQAALDAYTAELLAQLMAGLLDRDQIRRMHDAATRLAGLPR